MNRSKAEVRPRSVSVRHCCQHETPDQSVRHTDENLIAAAETHAANLEPGPAKCIRDRTASLRDTLAELQLFPGNAGLIGYADNLRDQIGSRIPEEGAHDATTA